MMNISIALEFLRNVLLGLSALIVFVTIVVGILLTNSEIKTMAEYAVGIFLIACFVEIMRKFGLFVIKNALNKAQY